MIVLSPAAAATVAGIAPLFDFYERYFEPQFGVREDSAEVNHLVKQVENRTSLGTVAAADDSFVFRLSLDDQLARDDRFDDQQVLMAAEKFFAAAKRRDFVADGGERTMLDLDQFLRIDHINAVAAELDLERGIARRVDRFQISVK